MLFGVNMESWYFFAMFNAAALLFLSIFTELILFWSRLHDEMRPSTVDGSDSMRFTHRQRRVFQIVVLVFAWASYIVLFVFYLQDEDLINQIVPYVTGGFFAVAAVFFAIYGGLIYRRVIQMPLRSTQVNTRIRRVLATAIIMTCAFVIRAILNMVIPSLILRKISLEYEWIVYTLTFCTLEVLPLVLVEILVVMRPKQREDGDIESVRIIYQEHYNNKRVNYVV